MVRYIYVKDKYILNKLRIVFKNQNFYQKFFDSNSNF